MLGLEFYIEQLLPYIIETLGGVASAVLVLLADLILIGLLGGTILFAFVLLLANIPEEKCEMLLSTFSLTPVTQEQITPKLEAVKTQPQPPKVFEETITGFFEDVDESVSVLPGVRIEENPVLEQSNEFRLVGFLDGLITENTQKIFVKDDDENIELYHMDSSSADQCQTSIQPDSSIKRTCQHKYGPLKHRTKTMTCSSRIIQATTTATSKNPTHSCHYSFEHF